MLSTKKNTTFRTDFPDCNFFMHSPPEKIWTFQVEFYTGSSTYVVASFAHPRHTEEAEGVRFKFKRLVTHRKEEIVLPFTLELVRP